MEQLQTVFSSDEELRSLVKWASLLQASNNFRCKLGIWFSPKPHFWYGFEILCALEEFALTWSFYNPEEYITKEGSVGVPTLRQASHLR